MIDVGAFVDFVMRIQYPRKEFVGLPCRSPLPETLELWMEYLDAAVNLADEQIRERYGRRRDFVDLRIQHGHVTISDFRIRLPYDDAEASSVFGINYRWKIRRWVASEGSYLYRLWLEWKYLQRGQVAEYYAKLDHVPEPGEGQVFRNIFGDTIIGPPDLDKARRELAFALPEHVDPTQAVLRRIDIERRRTPIVHTR